jgi:hypothetical protein
MESKASAQARPASALLKVTFSLLQADATPPTLFSSAGASNCGEWSGRSRRRALGFGDAGNDDDDEEKDDDCYVEASKKER